MNAITILCTIFILFGNGINTASSDSKVIKLDEDNWRALLESEWMVEFYAPWCPACKNLSPSWEKLASWSNDLNIKTAQIDVTLSPALSGRFLVTALPTIYHVVNGEFRQYRGARDANALIAFVEDHKWKEIEAVSQWKNPDSVQMTVVSYFFKLSHYLKEVNNVMLVEYGFPAWVTYVLFAIATILLGAILGLILVSIIDLILPPVPQNSRRSFQQAQGETAIGSAEEEVRDELIDDDDGDDDGNDTGSSTSEEEKYSGIDSNESNNEDGDNKKTGQNAKENKGDTKNQQSSPEVRKRKPRKAD